MSDEPLLTAEELATVLRVPIQMVREWETQGILPAVGEKDEVPKYRQREVVMF